MYAIYGKCILADCKMANKSGQKKLQLSLSIWQNLQMSGMDGDQEDVSHR